ncbi:hypothetical protein MSG28_012486 [Choristoneura fumiferana]|uniref:Uncharacterized protein n=1 Tax=Choristoneura fumiferana TaxID=7141 RepID=A0ACC0KDS7_CHOFU|nr:hypothetical protein MSG28_012486 [Choristoneura fumiferana]
MRAPLRSAACLMLLLCHISLVHCHQEGYYAEDGYQDDAIDVEDLTAACPTDRLLRARDTCHVDGADIDCVPKSVEPCSLGLCEQACEVRGERVWCSCHAGYRFHEEQYRRKTQPYCQDVDECATNNGGCSHRCVNDPGGFHCECPPTHVLDSDGRICAQPIVMPRPVKQLSDQLHTTQSALKKLMDNAVLKGEGDVGPRGPRGARGPKGSMDLMLLLLADIRHDIINLEEKVYKDGEHPERFNLQKAWRRQRKQEKLDKESRTAQELEAYTPPPIVDTQGPVEISPHGLNGEIPHDTESTTDWSLVKETEPSELSLQFTDMDEKLLEFHLLANSTHPGDEDEDLDADYDYTFY